MYNSIYPVKINPYVPPKKQKQVGESTDEPSKGAEAQKERALIQSENQKTNKKDVPQDTYERAQYPNGGKSQIDYSKSRVNIAQIITDFKNTATAIGTPDYIVEEVEQYLSLAESQSLKDAPNKKIIQANLKNASSILDDFISKTLNKKSKVVENWIEALFLQQVDYKADANTINPDFLVKLPDKNNKQIPVTPQKAQAPAQETPETPATVTSPAKEKNVYIPADPELKRLFIQGKKCSAAEDSENALAAFGAALSQAQAVGDTQAESMVCFEIGKLYDKQDNIEEALKYYNQSLINTQDNNLKAKAHYSMAQIYDDFVYFEPAVDHYFVAISYAGEAENFNAQTRALSDIADMFADRYDKTKTREFFGAAKNIAQESQEDKVLGAVYARSADTMKMLEENVSALNDYKESSKYYEKASSPLKMAKNYEKASQVMTKLGNSAKAESLLKKAYNLANYSGDKDYAAMIHQQLFNV